MFALNFQWPQNEYCTRVHLLAGDGDGQFRPLAIIAHLRADHPFDAGGTRRLQFLRSFRPQRGKGLAHLGPVRAILILQEDDLVAGAE